MGGKRRKAILAAVLAFLLFFSILFLGLEADHDCHGGDCAICAQVHAFLDLLRLLTLSSAVVLLTSGLRGIRILPREGIACIRRYSSPILLKVKLSD